MSDIVESWTVTDHGVAEPAEVERAIVLLGADDATLAYRVQGYIATREAEITRLRTFITALEDGNMAFLCDELDKAKAENARLRSLVEEAGKVVGPFAACLPTHDADRDEDDDPWCERSVAVSAHCVNFDDDHLTVEDFRAARSLFDKMKEG